MKKRVSAILWMAFGSMVIYTGCSKNVYLEPHTPISFYSTDVSVAPSYGDTVLRVSGSEHGAYLFRPAVALGAGHFVSWPVGLMIDPRTGVIDASVSEPGARYNVGFVNDRNGDTAFSQVVVAGMSFTNTVYICGSADSVLVPYNMGGGTASFLAGDGSINMNALKPGLQQVKVSYRMNGQGVQTTMVNVAFQGAATPAAVTTGAPTGTEAFGVTVAPQPKAAPVAVTTVKRPAPTTPRPPQIVIINKGH